MLRICKAPQSGGTDEQALDESHIDRIRDLSCLLRTTTHRAQLHTKRSTTLFWHRTAPVIARPLQCHIWLIRLQHQICRRAHDP